MGSLQNLPLTVGAVASLATAGMLVVHIILAVHVPRASTIQTISIMSAALEGIVLVVLGAWLVVAVRKIGVDPRRSGVLFGTSILICTLAAAASVAMIVALNNAMTSSITTVLGANRTTLLIVSALVLGLSFCCQLMFMVLFYMYGSGAGQGHRDDRRIPQMHMKTIRYSRTLEGQVFAKATASKEFQTPPQSSCGESVAETSFSTRTSLSRAVRPITSRTRLISTRDRHRPTSLDSQSLREGSIMTVDSMDSKDLSAADLHNRLVALGHGPLAQPPRTLETIPASPTVSRTPSPGNALDLPPPPPAAARRRSRSYSPARRPEPDLSQFEDPGEAHIHPLFRSDSPAPPNVTPGTVVTAAPNAGQVISDRLSVRRMRSGSLPTHGNSPLSHQNSFETFRDGTPSVHEERDGAITPSSNGTTGSSRRDLTPPIPEWIMAAGSRTSLTGYEIRKSRIDEDSSYRP